MKAKQKIFNKLRKEKRKIIFFLPVFFGVLFVFMSPFGGTETAHALWPFEGTVDAVVNGLMKMLVNVIMFIPAKLAGMSAGLLNMTVTLTVSKMGNIVNTNGINETWKALRDVSNIMFIAILIWIGISTILNLPENYTKLLPKLIIIALLINFSLFITKFVIDISNAFSIEVLQLIEFEGCDYENPGKKCEENGLAGAFIQKMGITSFYNLKNDTGNSLIEDEQDIGKLITIAVLGAIFLFVAAFIFFAASILLIIRFIVLLFLIILSPLAFAAMVLPKTKQHATKWWNALFNQAFFAPFFFLLIFVTLKIIDGLGSVGIGAEDGNALNHTLAQAIIKNDVSSLSIVLMFVIIAGLFVASLFIAKEMGMQGSTAMMKWGTSARKWGQGVAGRKAVGWTSSGLLKGYNRMQSKIDNAEGLGGTLARTARKGASIASWGMLSDKAIKGTLEKGKQAKFGSKESFEDRRKARRERVKEISEAGKERKAENTLKKFKKNKATRGEVEDSVKRLSNKQLEEMDSNELARPELASGLKASQFDYLMKSDELNQTAKDNIRAKREEGMNKRIDDEDVDSVIKGSNKDIAKLPAGILTREDVAKKLKPSVLSRLATEGELSQDQRNKIRRTIEDEATTPGVTPSQEVIDSANWLTSQAGAIF